MSTCQRGEEWVGRMRQELMGEVDSVLEEVRSCVKGGRGYRSAIDCPMPLRLDHS